MPAPVLLPLPLPLPLPLRRRLLLLLTLLRPTLQVGVDNSHVDEELLVEVSSGAAAPALLPPLGGRVQSLTPRGGLPMRIGRPSRFFMAVRARRLAFGIVDGRHK